MAPAGSLAPGRFDRSFVIRTIRDFSIGLLLIIAAGARRPIRP